MAANSIHEMKMTVKSSETDFRHQLKLSNLFLWLQDAASDHAASLGFGFEDLAKHDLAWVLSRMKVRAYDFPQMGETVTLKTWPKGIHQKIFYMRDYTLTGEDGRKLAVATSAFLIIDTRTRRMAIPNALKLSASMPDNGGLSAIDEPLEHLTPVDHLRDCYSVHAGYSMVDVVGHVNNARYIDWISDCFPMEDYQTHRAGWLQINYLNEVKPGDVVKLERGEQPAQPNVAFIVGMNQTTNTKAFEAELGWD